MIAYVAPFVVGTLGVLCYWFLVQKRHRTALLALPAYFLISTTASVAYLEANPTYLIETGLVSRPTGATARHVMLAVVLLGAASVVATRLGRRIERSKPRLPERDLAFALALTLLAVQSLNALFSGPLPFPWAGIGRHQFWAQIRFPIIAEGIGLLIAPAGVLAGALLGEATATLTPRSFKHRRRAMFLVVFYFSYLFATGQRFSGGLAGACLVGGSFLVVRHAQNRPLRTGRYAFLGVIALGLLVVLSLGDLAGRDIARREGGALGALAYRSFALQGNVYYAADLRAMAGESPEVSLLSADFEETLFDFSPRSLAGEYVRSGVNLAGTLPGLAVYQLGWTLGLLLLALFGTGMGVVAGTLAGALTTQRYLATIPLAYLSLRVFSIVGRGTFADLNDPRLIILGLGIVAAWVGLPARPGVQSMASLQGTRP